MEEAERLKLERLLAELEVFKGRHTELISVYIPAGYSLTTMIKTLESEKATALNIKDKATRKNVLDALEKILRHLALYKATPANGLTIFCGNVSEVEGRPDIRLWSVEPPMPLRTKIYHCNKTFLLAPLREMTLVKAVYGLLVLDKREATFGLLEGKAVKVLRRLTSWVPGKARAGGQSAARFARIREALAKEFYKRIAEIAKAEFYERKLKGVLLGGPGPSKEEFLAEGDLITAVREKILAVRDVGYTDEHGLDLLVAACSDVLAKEEIAKEKETLTLFFTRLAKEPATVVYGVERTRKALALGAVDELLLSTALDPAEADAFEREAKKTGTKVTLVSTETAEGVQFRNMARVGGFLRFPVR